ncbi:nucleotidyltransferase [Bacteroidota bacterium]
MDQRQLPEDFKEFLKLLNSNNVQYLLVGGWAVGFYGYSRFTADMDIFIGISEENISSMKLALLEFGVPEFDRSMLTTKGNVFRIGRVPLRIEIINEISGVDFDDAFIHKEYVELENQLRIPIISVDDLFKNKSSTGRAKDMADLEELRKFLG